MKNLILILITQIFPIWFAFILILWFSLSLVCVLIFSYYYESDLTHLYKFKIIKNYSLRKDNKKYLFITNMELYSLIIPILNLFLVITLMVNFDLRNTEKLVCKILLWGNWETGFFLMIDGVSCLFFLIVSLTFFLCSIYVVFSYEKTYLNAMHKDKRFLLILMSIIQLLMYLFFSVGNIFIMFLVLEGSLIPMFYMMNMYGTRPRRIYGTYLLLFYTILGSMFFLLGIFLFYSLTGSLSILDFNRIFMNLNNEWDSYNIDPDLLYLLWVFLFLGFLPKIPVYPVHIWLTEAHVEAPTVGSAILSGIYLKLALYGYFRLLYALPDAFEYYKPFTLSLCTISILYSSLSVLRQCDVKKILAYFSITHMNFSLLAFFTRIEDGITGAFMGSISHTIVSVGLFLMIGMIYQRVRSRQFNDIIGAANAIPLLAVSLFLIMLANGSFPATGLFIAELFGFFGISLSNEEITIINSIIMALGTICCVWFLTKLVFGAFSTKEPLEDIKDLNFGELVIVYFVLFSILVTGIFPTYFYDYIYWYIISYLLI